MGGAAKTVADDYRGPGTKVVGMQGLGGTKKLLGCGGKNKPS